MLRVMALDAIALLRLPATDLPGGAVLRTLDDGVLVRTRASFASEPDELALALRRIAGDALDRHRDERGVLMIPDVARPAASTYEGVVEEVGEGGTWVSLEEDEEAGLEGDLLATMMNAMSTPEMQSAIARARDVFASGDPAAAQARMVELARSMSGVIEPGEDAEVESEMRAMVERHTGGAGAGGAGALGAEGGLPVDLGALMSDPAFQRMVDDVRAQLLSDPSKLAQLQSMFGAMSDEEDEDEDEGDGGARS